jgi:hypothetical protein
MNINGIDSHYLSRCKKFLEEFFISIEFQSDSDVESIETWSDVVNGFFTSNEWKQMSLLMPWEKAKISTSDYLTLGSRFGTGDVSLLTPTEIIECAHFIKAESLVFPSIDKLNEDYALEIDCEFATYPILAIPNQSYWELLSSGHEFNDRVHIGKFFNSHETCVSLSYSSDCRYVWYIMYLHEITLDSTSILYWATLH